MEKIGSNNRNYWRNLVTRMTLVLVTVTIIVLFLPRSEGSMYHYDVGKPWVYSDMIAKFDFPVFKTQEALKSEQDSVRKSFVPYYYKADYVGERNIKKFIFAF